MKKKVLILYIIASLCILLVGCTSKINESTKESANESKIEELQEQVKSYEEDIAKLQDEISNNELDIKYLNEEKDEYKKFIDSSIKYFNKNELLELAENEWSYGIKVNENPIQTNGVLEIDKNTFKIVVFERQSAYPSLPEEIHRTGAISDNYYDHLKILDIEPSNIGVSDGTVVQGFFYEFENIQKGTLIELEISNEL